MIIENSVECKRRFSPAPLTAFRNVFQYSQNTIVEKKLYVFFIFSETRTTNSVNVVLNVCVVTYARVKPPCGVSLIENPTTVYLHVTYKTNVRKVARKAVLMYSLIFAQKTEQSNAGVFRTRTEKSCEIKRLGAKNTFTKPNENEQEGNFRLYRKTIGHIARDGNVGRARKQTFPVSITAKLFIFRTVRVDHVIRCVI